ncbi:MAG: nucleotidyltransferase family protein [Caldilineaceae bacterium]|nr:nucleotidyltransferase family protein [Caldilineaceae bacterium]
MEQVTAVILAGGLGTRLRPAVADRPKVLAEVDGKPFLAYLLDQLISSGLQHVVLCTGYLGEQIERTFGERYRSLALAYSQEPEPLGTGGALKYALPLLRSDPILAMNGDSVCMADLQAFYRWYQAHDMTTGALMLTQVDDVGRYGQVQCNQDAQIVGFTEKGMGQGMGWINAGIYLLSQRLLRSIPDGRAVSVERELFPHWLAQGLYGFQSYGDFIDIGLPKTYFAAADFLQSNRLYIS